jgi:hypothetical protein
MKAIALAQRRQQRRAGPAISLFPFLAVLICTMGALVPLFLAIARQARLEALRAATVKATQRHDDTRAEFENVEWRIEQLKESRQKTETQLAEARMSLGHVEDHTRRLRQQVQELRVKWDASRQSDQQGSRQRSELEGELETLRKELAQAERELSDAKRAAAEQPRSYAIVPFQGPNQTRRRPIYVECTATAVILQPEGIVLSAADFDGPPGPGNPLAAAMRAEREYLLRGGLDPHVVGEPYPLLLIRPDGIVAYWAARAALKTWGTDFGYELIDDEWKLAFPPADPQLAREVLEAVQQSRARQQRLIASAPRVYGGRAGASGGSGGYAPGGYVPGAPGGTFASRFGSDDNAGNEGGGGIGGVGGGGGDNGGGRYASPDGSARGTGGGRYGTGGTAVGGSGAGSSSARGTGNGGPYASGGTGNGATGGIGVGGSGNVGSGGYGGGSASGGGTGAPDGAGSGNPLRGTGSSGSGGSPGGMAQPADRTLNLMPPSEPAGTRPANSGSAQSEPGQPGEMLRPGEWRPTPPAPPPKPLKDDKIDEDDKHDRRGKPPKKPKSLAATHGLDWALRNAASGATPIARPIRVAVHADRLVVLPDRGNAGGKIISLDRHTESAVGPFVSALQTHIESWGMAGNRMYWRPILQVQVAPGGEERFRDLSVLLEGSGLTVERKSGQ